MKQKQILISIFIYCLFLSATSHANDLSIEFSQEENYYDQLLNHELFPENNTENISGNSLLDSFIDQRKIEGYQNWISMVEFILNTGDSICPDEGSLPWLLRKYLQLKDSVLIILNGSQFPEIEAMLDNPDLSPEEKNDRINKFYADRKSYIENTVHKYAFAKKREREREYEILASILPPLVVVSTVIVSATVIASALSAGIINKSAIYSQFAGVMNNIWNGAAASANVVFVTAMSSTLKCFPGCNLGCSPQCDILKNTLTMSFKSKTTFDVEENIMELIKLQGITTSARIAYQLPYNDAVKSIRDVAVPLILIPLHFIAQRRPDTLASVLEYTAAAVAYGSISSALKPTYGLDQLIVLVKNIMSVQFMFPETNTPIRMIIITGLKGSVGFLSDHCSTTINAMAPMVIMAAPAIYMEANKQTVPVINIRPKFLLGGAMIAGDVIASVQEGFPEHLLIPIILITTNLPNTGNWKGLGWGVALLFPPLNYFFGTQDQ